MTIIFLPLSTVASILGMNVNDIRSMPQDQWVFWSIALPLTFIVITLCLIWAGELGNVWRGFSNLWTTSRGKGYVALSEGTDSDSLLDIRVHSGRTRRKGYYPDDDVL